jgi:hypothetical protein
MAQIVRIPQLHQFIGFVYWIYLFVDTRIALPTGVICVPYHHLYTFIKLFYLFSSLLISRAVVMASRVIIIVPPGGMDHLMETLQTYIAGKNENKTVKIAVINQPAMI